MLTPRVRAHEDPCPNCGSLEVITHRETGIYCHDCGTRVVMAKPTGAQQARPVGPKAP